MNLKNKKVLVYGAGRSGLSAIKLLKHAQAEVYLYDDDIITTSGVTTISDINGIINKVDLIVLSPSVSIENPILNRAVKEGRVISEIELAYGFLDSELIAVSGTNGKTTVTLMINEIINRAGFISYALGNIGIPLSEKVLELTPADTAVVEISTFQLEGCSEFSPDIAVLSNVTSDHIDRHGSLDKYISLKSKLFQKQINRDIAIINADDETSLRIAKEINSDLYYFSTKKPVRGAYVESGEIYFEDKGKIHIASISELSLSGDFNIQNALAATAACIKKGINPEIIRLVLKSFEPPEFRCALIGEKMGKRFYNDSKGTNVAATLASAKTMDGKTVLILGGRSKGENFEELFKNLPKNIIHSFVTGENAPEIIEGALKCGYYNISHRATLKECFMESVVIVADNVLFSPASSSFDRYNDYVERGKIFNSYFEAL